MNQAQINLHIEELLLRDVPYALRHRIAAAVEHELARLLSEQDLPPSITQGGYIPHIDIGNNSESPHLNPLRVEEVLPP